MRIHGPFPPKIFVSSFGHEHLVLCNFLFNFLKGFLNTVVIFLSPHQTFDNAKKILVTSILNAVTNHLALWFRVSLKVSLLLVKIQVCTVHVNTSLLFRNFLKIHHFVLMVSRFTQHLLSEELDFTSCGRQVDIVATLQQCWLTLWLASLLLSHLGLESIVYKGILSVFIWCYCCHGSNVLCFGGPSPRGIQ